MTTVGFEPLWTIEDVSAFLRVPVKTIYEWRRHKRGPKARKLGKHLRYEPSHVREWFASQMS